MLEVLALVLTFLLNVPFGYWRSATRKLSKEWFLAVHAPVPLIFLLRIASSAPLHHIPVFVVAFFLGQSSGGKLRKIIAGKIKASKCLAIDLLRLVL